MMENVRQDQALSRGEKRKTDPHFTATTEGHGAELTDSLSTVPLAC